MNKEETILDEEQVKEDLEMMSKNLLEAVNLIKKVYERMSEIYIRLK